MDGRGPLLHVGRPGKGDILHAELVEDPLFHNLAQAFAADAFDDLSDPVDVRAVFPLRARIE